MKPAAISVRAAARKKQSSDRVYSKMQTKYKSSKGADDVKRLKRILALALTLLLLFGIMPSAAAESASATTLRLAAYSGWSSRMPRYSSPVKYSTSSASEIMPSSTRYLMWSSQNSPIFPIGISSTVIFSSFCAR